MIQCVYIAESIHIYIYMCEDELLFVSVLARQAPQAASTALLARTRRLVPRSARMPARSGLAARRCMIFSQD